MVILLVLCRHRSASDRRPERKTAELREEAYDLLGMWISSQTLPSSGGGWVGIIQGGTVRIGLAIEGNRRAVEACWELYAPAAALQLWLTARLVMRPCRCTCLYCIRVRHLGVGGMGLSSV